MAVTKKTTAPPLGGLTPPAGSLRPQAAYAPDAYGVLPPGIPPGLRPRATRSPFPVPQRGKKSPPVRGGLRPPCPALRAANATPLGKPTVSPAPARRAAPPSLPVRQLGGLTSGQARGGLKSGPGGLVDSTLGGRCSFFPARLWKAAFAGVPQASTASDFGRAQVRTSSVNTFLFCRTWERTPSVNRFELTPELLAHLIRQLLSVDIFEKTT
jgi:hypothetical protein